MIRSLYIARTGMDAHQTQLDVITNNLANVSTNGFKRARAVFEDLLYQTMRQPGAQSSQQTTIPSGLQLGTGVRPVATERIHTQGNLTQTGNTLDIAVQGQGFFQIQMPDGTLAYTRDGAFQKDAQGMMVTSSGYQLQPPVTIPSNAVSVTIGRDGAVSALLAGQTAPTQIGSIMLSTFVNPGGLQSMGENLYVETASSGTASSNTPGNNGTGLLNQGYVETSNVNVVEELVNMIQTQRAYEINSRAIQTSDQMLAKLTQLERVQERVMNGLIGSMKGVGLLLLAAAALAGCVAATPPTTVHQPMTVRPPARNDYAGNSGAIYQLGAVRPLFEDRRARNVGDTLVINLAEKTAAAKKSGSTAERTHGIDFSVPSVVGIPLKSMQGSLLEADNASKFAGKGDSSANNDFTGTITVTVIEVYPNGNLLVSGEKQVAINQGQEFIRFSGVVNPVQISTSNTVQSTQVADARIEYKANGYIDEAQVMGWLARFFLTFLPL